MKLNLRESFNKSVNVIDNASQIDLIKVQNVFLVSVCYLLIPLESFTGDHRSFAGTLVCMHLKPDEKLLILNQHFPVKELLLSAIIFTFHFVALDSGNSDYTCLIHPTEIVQ